MSAPTNPPTPRAGCASDWICSDPKCAAVNVDERIRCRCCKRKRDPVPPASALAATPEPERFDLAEQLNDLVNATQDGDEDRAERAQDAIVEAFARVTARPTGEEADDTMLVTNAALAHAEYAVQDEAEAAAIRQACARLTTQATALAALRDEVRGAYACGMIDGHRRARLHEGPLPGSIVNGAAEKYVRAARSATPTEGDDR